MHTLTGSIMVVKKGLIRSVKNDRNISYFATKIPEIDIPDFLALSGSVQAPTLFFISLKEFSRPSQTDVCTKGLKVCISRTYCKAREGETETRLASGNARPT
ncbi:hypothetical protein AVEN_104056-1 [Araneus ventricosus]|uniref:Uncharacterized protein n=1 Tax=Araneus ventricosus TaxID=182803 RepID=A0A4Y2KDP9_ARAVE|nr:hypothetical protein AVEN_104056-1 [Araneus ventricosus]